MHEELEKLSKEEHFFIKIIKNLPKRVAAMKWANDGVFQMSDYNCAVEERHESDVNVSNVNT